MLCKKCKQIIPNSSKFCLYCGANLTETPKKQKHYRSHGHGNISYYKNCPNNPYRARVKIGNKTVSLGYFESSKAADRAITEFMADYDESVSLRIDWTLQRFYDTWSEKAFTKLSKSSVIAYKASWKHLENIAHQKMKDLKTANYQTCIDDASRSGKSRSTCNTIRALISLLCQEAMKDDVIDKNYAGLLELPANDKREKDIFTDDEIELLKQHEKDVEAKIILILIYTGLRIGEFLKLTPNDVNTKDWYLVGGSKTAAGKNRTVPILPPIRKYFSELILASSSPDSKLLKCSYHTYKNNYFYGYLMKLGILTQKEIEKGEQARLTPHSTRHTFASLARRAGVEKDVLTRIIGHSDYTTTDEIYVSMDSEMLSNELEKIAK